MTSKSRKQQLEEMLAQDPNDPFLRYALAMEHLSANDDEAAARGFAELLALDPTYVPAYLQAGKTLGRLGRHQQAAEVFQRGIEIRADKMITIPRTRCKSFSRR